MGETVFERMMSWAAERGWNQSEVAARLGVSPQNITNWKARGVPSDRLLDISRAFGRPVDVLIGASPDGGPSISSWPYPTLSEDKLRSLSSDDACRLEGIILLGAAQLGLDVKK